MPAMTSERLTRIFTIAFVLLFFAYLFGPLLVMGLSAFNSSSFPRVSPWDCFTVEWFDVLANDEDLMKGLRNSLTIAFGVVIVAVPLGLAGALMLTQVTSRLRPWYYTIVISPILIPGVVLGISTLVFWDRLGRMFNAGYDSFFYDGIFLTIVGQSTFVAAYAMLIFISRLQRFDTVQEEAALDLGATHVQTFRKILLPFLKPAIASACVLGFLASFENYNTTIFTIVSKSTLTTVLASKVRYGINPSISALAVIIIVLTLIGAIYFEILKRREEKYQRDVDQLVRTGSSDRAQKANLWANPALILVTLVFIAGLGTVYMSGTIGVDECKIVLNERKAKETARKVKEFKNRQMFKNMAPSSQPATETDVVTQPEVQAKGTEGYQNIFAPTNLEGQVDSETKADSNDSTEAKGTENYNSIFAPTNLKKQTESQ
ncbi:MAG: spermidine/putrescine transport system permease protein [Parasphingorhabdus sp.]|jgi:spermidine/putrescine transport system permease protein